MVPPKGIAMPFLSYGRTSLLVSFLAAGTLVGIGRREAQTKEHATAAPESWRSWRP
jgi:cell division protein FtsW (lipid II flippase)